MNFELDPDQLALRDAVSRFLQDEYGLQRRKTLTERPYGASSFMWKSFAELGLHGLLIPEAYGGSEKSILDACVVQEEFGKHLVLEPFWMSAVAGVAVLNAAASDEQKGRIFPHVVSGDWALAVASPWLGSLFPPGRPLLTASRAAECWRISGTTPFIVGADTNTATIVHALGDNGGQHLFVIEPEQDGCRMNRYKCHDGTRGADLFFDGAEVEERNHLSVAKVETALSDARSFALASLCSEAVGAMSAAVELTLNYLRARKQFGVSLSSFQVLQHRCVDMLVELERARSMSVLAGVSASERLSTRRHINLAASKFQISRSARFIGQQAIQLHGGMGMTDEYAAGHYFRRLTAIEATLGSCDVHLAAVVAEGGLASDSLA